MTTSPECSYTKSDHRGWIGNPGDAVRGALRNAAGAKISLELTLSCVRRRRSAYGWRPAPGSGRCLHSRSATAGKFLPPSLHPRQRVRRSECGLAPHGMSAACLHHATAPPKPESPGRGVATYRARAGCAQTRRLRDETAVAVEPPSWRRSRATLRVTVQLRRVVKKRAGPGPQSASWSVHLADAPATPARFDLPASGLQSGFPDRCCIGSGRRIARRASCATYLPQSDFPDLRWCELYVRQGPCARRQSRVLHS